ncbi:MAG: cofactor-independent phosphoglycerate mutase [Deltaproteobacteria bacterium RBG_16_54_18]|nr:MAG: cofactor-independent phosphoglycerate mutase [Deltaproteobacteria bacterium RBG_16_54_18]
MKYLILIGDGMADRPIAKLGGKTPLMVARTPNMDALAQQGEIGLAHTIPPGMPKGSEIANLSIFGYDPRRYYTGRGPLEAASIGVKLSPDDCAFRLNLVNLEAVGGSVIMGDYSAGHITTEEARELIKGLDKAFGNVAFHFYPGVSYRHLLVWKGKGDKIKTTPPHDITEQAIGAYLPTGDGAQELIQLMTDTQTFLHAHPINQRRRQAGNREANATWPWGQGRAPQMPTLTERFGLKGSVISAVDLIKGIGIYAGLKVITVPGATGYLDTNYQGKAEYALRALERDDFIYLHVEAPDEASHNGDLEAKIAAIESFDELVVGTIVQGMAQRGAYRIMILPDHPTPIEIKTHAEDPVPFVLYDSADKRASGAGGFDEAAAAKSGVVVAEGHRLIERLIGGQV